MLKPLHEMDPDVVKKLIEGHEDVIAPAVAQEQATLGGSTCPFCQGPMDARVNPKRPFIKGKVLPNKVLVCLQCEAEVDLHSKIVVKMPTASSG